MSTTLPSSAVVVPFRPNKSYLKLQHGLLRGTLFVSLSTEEQLLFIRIAARYNGKNNGRIPYSVRDGIKELHKGQATVYRASHRLQDLGLIICRKPGNRTGPSEWEIPEFATRCISPEPAYVSPQIHPLAKGVSTADTKREEKTLGVEKERDSGNRKEGSGLPSEARKTASQPSDNPSPSITISHSRYVAAGTAAMAALELIERATRPIAPRDENGGAWVSAKELEAVTAVTAMRGRP
jgi:hypothetical protein